MAVSQGRKNSEMRQAAWKRAQEHRARARLRGDSLGPAECKGNGLMTKTQFSRVDQRPGPSISIQARRVDSGQQTRTS